MRQIHYQHGISGLWVLVTLLTSLTSALAGSQPPEQDATAVLTQARAARLERQAAYRKQMAEFAQQGKIPQAIEAVNKFMELERELGGENTPAMAFALRQLAEIAVRQRHDTEAINHLRKALEVERPVHGDGHWHVADVRGELAYVEALSKLGADERDKVAQAEACAFTSRAATRVGRLPPCSR